MNPPHAKHEPLPSHYIAVEEIRPAVEYAGRGEFDRTLWWQGALIQPCLLLLESGTLEGRTPAGNFVAPAGSLVCFRPSNKRAWGITGPAVVWEMGVRFAPAPHQHLIPWLPDVGPMPLFVKLGDSFSRARELIEMIYAELPRTPLADQLRVRAALYELLALVRDAARAGAQDRAGAGTPGTPPRPRRTEMDAWQRAGLRLESDLQRPLTVEKLAHDLKLSPDHFTRRFRRRFGMSPHVCRTRAKLREALRMLRGSSEKSADAEPIKTVAYRLGFSDPKAFARLFKRHLGLNPSQLTATDTDATGRATREGSPIELFPGNTHVLPADSASIDPFAELTKIVATAPPPFRPETILYQRAK